MNFTDAYASFTRTRDAHYADCRAALIKTLTQWESLLREQPEPEPPRGIFAPLLRADFDRLNSYRQLLARNRNRAAEALAHFDAARKKDEHSPEDKAEIWRRLNAEDPAISVAFQAEIARLDEEEAQLREAQRREHEHKEHLSRELEALKIKTGITYTVMQPNREARGFMPPWRTKRRATIEQRIDVGDVPYVCAAPKDGDPSAGRFLYPWRDEMERHMHREVWFWYDDADRFYWTPVLGTKAPLVNGGSSGTGGIGRVREIEHGQAFLPPPDGLEQGRER